jgi:hypothetical protein
MARSINSISQSIKADFVANPTIAAAYELDQSKSFDDQFSNVSIEGLLIYVVATAIYLIERTIDTFTQEINQRIINDAVCSIPWYVNKVLNYQHGHPLVFIPQSYSFGYEIENNEAKIVKYAAVRQIEGTVTKLQILTNKEGKVPLTSDEHLAFQAYVRQIGAAGIHYDFITALPTDVRITAQIIYDPLLLNGSGLLHGTTTNTVNEALLNYINNVAFGGVILKSKLVDAIQSALGVYDLNLELLELYIDEAWEEVEGLEGISPSGSFLLTVDNLDLSFSPKV